MPKYANSPKYHPKLSNTPRTKKIWPFSKGKRQSTDASPNPTQMLELSDEDFKALNEEKLNIPEMNGKFSTEKHKS